MHPQKTNRREFLAGLAAASGGATLLSSGAHLTESAFPPERPQDHSAQTPGKTYERLGYKRLIIDYHFSEFNPKTLEKANAAEIIEAVKALEVDSLLLYSKDHWGNVYHKSALSKRHHNVPQDLFGEVLSGVKKHGIKVVAYTTVCWDEDSARKHPDWVMLNNEDRPIHLDDGSVSAKWKFLCLNSPYRAYFLRQMDELICNYDFEALFLDIIIQHRALTCYNPCCLKKWKERYGTDLPRQLSDADYAQYLDFNRETVELLFRDIKDISIRYNKKFMMTHNFGLTYAYDDYLASEFDTHGVDFYLPSIRAKMFRARADGKEVELIGHRFNKLWDFTLKPAPLMQFEVSTAIAHNCAMCYVDQPYLDGSLDPQVYQALKSAFTAADDLVPKVRGTTPYGEIGLLSSERSFEFDYSTYRDFSGAYAMLSQLHWPFDVITEAGLTEESLAQFQALVVPDVVHLSADQVSAVRRYVERGGNLVYCYRSATKDENAQRLEQASFGFTKIQEDSTNQASFIRPMWNVGSRYLRVSEVAIFDAPNASEVLGTITNPALRITETEWITHNVMPGDDTSTPAVVTGKWGGGHFLYYGFRLFNEFVEQAHPALFQMFEKGLRVLHTPAIWVDAPGNVEAVFCKVSNRLRIILINGIGSKVMTGDMWSGERGMRGHVTIPEIVPLHGIILKTTMPVRAASDLHGNALSVRREQSSMQISLPILQTYNLVELALDEIPAPKTN